MTDNLVSKTGNGELVKELLTRCCPATVVDLMAQECREQLVHAAEKYGDDDSLAKYWRQRAVVLAAVKPLCEDGALTP